MFESSRIVRIVVVAALAAIAIVLSAPVVPDSLKLHVGAAPPPPLRADDAWAAYIAPESVCPGRDDLGAPAAAQERTMRCLVDFARSRTGLRPLPSSSLLDRSARLKADDIVRCRDFSHTACGKAFEATFDAVGYPAATGENIAWGAGAAASPRIVIDGWLNSPHHRENLFLPGYVEQGMAMVRAHRFQGSRSVQVWVNQFGLPR